VKSGAGGLLDIELCIQAGTILTGQNTPVNPKAMISPLLKSSWLDTETATLFDEALTLYALLLHLKRVATGETAQMDKSGLGLERVLLDRSGSPDIATLLSRLAELRTRSAKAVAARLDVP
jgi:glutamine synthetase adenylyltransferase